MSWIHRIFLLLVVSLVGALTIAACSTAPAIVPTAPTPTPASLAPAATQTPTTAPTSASAATPTKAAVAQPTATKVPVAVATVVGPDTGEASGSANAVFATAIRVNPPQPVSGPDYVTFYVTFNNTSGKTQQLKWYVKIWSPASSTQSFGETAKLITNIPPGTSEVASSSNWRTNSMNCEPFTARVYWLHADVNFGNPNEFKKPDGSPGPIANFQVCPMTPKP